MTAHSFGTLGVIKLNLLARYLEFFSTALQRRPSPEQPSTRKRPAAPPSIST